MSGPVNRPPLGLLGLFDIRGAGGTYPSQMADVITPEIETRFMVRGQPGQEQIEASFAIAAAQFVPFANSLQVPQTEFWFLSEYTLLIVLAADQAISFQPTYYPVQVAPVRPFPLGDIRAQPTALGTVSGFLAAATYDMPRILPPGSALSANIEAFTIGASAQPSLLMVARIIRLRA